MQKMVTAAAFRLKGGGWYETDFKKDNKKNVADAGTGTASKEKSAGESKAVAEKKPAAASTGGTTTTTKSPKT
jgi:predicted nucleic acid-binding Zn ribbon protein